MTARPSRSSTWTSTTAGEIPVVEEIELQTFRSHRIEQVDAEPATGTDSEVMAIQWKSRKAKCRDTLHPANDFVVGHYGGGWRCLSSPMSITIDIVVEHLPHSLILLFRHPSDSQSLRQRLRPQATATQHSCPNIIPTPILPSPCWWGGMRPVQLHRQHRLSRGGPGDHNDSEYTDILRPDPRGNATIRSWELGWAGLVTARDYDTYGPPPSSGRSPYGRTLTCLNKASCVCVNKTCKACWTLNGRKLTDGTTLEYNPALIAERIEWNAETAVTVHRSSNAQSNLKTLRRPPTGSYFRTEKKPDLIGGDGDGPTPFIEKINELGSQGWPRASRRTALQDELLPAAAVAGPHRLVINRYHFRASMSSGAVGGCRRLAFPSGIQG
ncbi:MAG: hypothetical protein Q9207_003043 [Kuettlingeria erythrocarpa]